MRIVSFNANGLRSAAGKGFFDWFAGQGADILCLQETKAQEHQLRVPAFLPEGYGAWVRDATTKKGYSGVAVDPLVVGGALACGVALSLIEV